MFPNLYARTQRSIRQHTSKLLNIFGAPVTLKTCSFFPFLFLFPCICLYMCANRTPFVDSVNISQIFNIFYLPFHEREKAHI